MDLLLAFKLLKANSIFILYHGYMVYLLSTIKTLQILIKWMNSGENFDRLIMNYIKRTPEVPRSSEAELLSGCIVNLLLKCEDCLEAGHGDMA